MGISRLADCKECQLTARTRQATTHVDVQLVTLLLKQQEIQCITWLKLISCPRITIGGSAQHSQRLFVAWWSQILFKAHSGFTVTKANETCFELVPMFRTVFDIAVPDQHFQWPASTFHIWRLHQISTNWLRSIDLCVEKDLFAFSCLGCRTCIWSNRENFDRQMTQSVGWLCNFLLLDTHENVDNGHFDASLNKSHLADLWQHTRALCNTTWLALLRSEARFNFKVTLASRFLRRTGPVLNWFQCFECTCSVQHVLSRVECVRHNGMLSGETSFFVSFQGNWSAGLVLPTEESEVLLSTPVL